MADLNEKMNPETCDHNCDACEGCDAEYEENLIALCDEEGNEVVFEWLDTVEYGEEYYGVFIPVEEESDDVIILRVSLNENDEEVYDGIEDQALVNKIFEIFKEQNKDNFKFAD